MSPLDVLREAANRLPGATIDGLRLEIEGQLVAVASTTQVIATPALVYNGFQDVTVLGRSVTTPTHHNDPVGRVVAAIQERQSVRTALEASHAA